MFINRKHVFYYINLHVIKFIKVIPKLGLGVHNTRSSIYHLLAIQ